jgi:hypothetical protein
MAKHNKKRNVGLMHEQLIRYASEKIVEGLDIRAEDALRILNKNFHKQSELFREFRLFNSLVHTRVPTKEVARKIINESRLACKNHDNTKLRTEKSSLIKDINHQLNTQDFYDKKIKEYRVFATVQALLNEWRGAQKLSPAEIVAYESGLENWLTREASPNSLSKTAHANPLSLQIMIEKFNKKYKNSLGKDQVRLLESCLLNDEPAVVIQINALKNKATTALDSFYIRCENKVLNNKREIIAEKIDRLTPSLSEMSISRALTLAKLISEMESEDE